MVPPGALLPAQADAARQVGLGIDVNEQHLPPLGCERGGEVDGRRGLPHATLLIRDGLYLVHLQARYRYWSIDQ